MAGEEAKNGELSEKETAGEATKAKKKKRKNKKRKKKATDSISIDTSDQMNLAAADFVPSGATTLPF